MRTQTGDSVVWRTFLVCAVAGLFLGTMPGCAGRSARRAAAQAEQAANYHLAYELYCESAARSPSNKTAIAGMNRTARSAARHWRQQAEKARRRGDYSQAWKHWMRVLTIRPDQRSTADQIRRLEREQPGAIADARRAWLASGEPSLRVAESPSSPPARDADPPGEAIAGVEPPALSVLEPDEPPPGSPTPSEPQSATAADGGPAPQQRNTAPAGQSPPTRRPTTGHRAVPRPPVNHQREQEYELVATVSRDNRRFPKMVETMDGLYVKVLDTDPGPDADMAVYRGRHRIREKKNMTVGQRLTVQGHSGRRYDVIMLSIIDQTETVRFAIRPVG